MGMSYNLGPQYPFKKFSPFINHGADGVQPACGVSRNASPSMNPQMARVNTEEQDTVGEIAGSGLYLKQLSGIFVA